MPIRVIIAKYSEVRSTYDFQIVCQARVSHREIIRGRVRCLRVFVCKGCVRIVHYLAVAVVFHHDDEHVIQTGNSSCGTAPSPANIVLTNNVATIPTIAAFFFIEFTFSGRVSAEPRPVGPCATAATLGQSC